MGTYRAVASSENPGGHVILGGENVPPLVEIGLTEVLRLKEFCNRGRGLSAAI